MAKSDAVGANRYQRVGASAPATEKASWEDAEADMLWKAITAVTDGGDAVMLSRTRDGGAVVLTLLAGDERMKHYATGAEAIARLLTETLEAARSE